MSKYIKILAILLALVAMPARADMPDYPDDAEFLKCRRMNIDSDICQREQIQRALERVKRLYKMILGNPKIVEWNGTLEKDADVLRDMFESWTAFRNRLCSVSYLATRYVEPIYNEKYSCNTYYILHKEDHLEKIDMLLRGGAPKNQMDFKFLYIYDHDDEYENCIQKNRNELCIDEELQRSTQDIKDFYKTFANDDMVGAWNNGDGLKSGNYRDMFDSWVAYRNRICSLAVWAYQKYYGPQSIRLNDCIQYYNREKLETLMNLINVAHSSLDRTDFSDNDGGLAEGKTIKPLTHKIDAGQGYAQETLTEDKPAETTSAQQNQPLTKSEAVKQKAGEKGKDAQIPSWANGR